MKQILKQDNRSVVTRDGDKVIKTFGVPRPEFSSRHNWLFHYESFYNMYGGVVRVHEANENRMVMDYVDGSPLEELWWRERKLAHGLAYKAFAAILQNLSNMADYSSNLEKVWFHNDAGSHNHVYSDGEFVLIDPDSFKMVKNPYPGAFVSPLHPLHQILTTLFIMHERNYNEHVK